MMTLSNEGKKNRNALPNLCQLAIHYLGIPVTEAASKRVFLSAGNIISPKRESLATHVEELVFLHENQILCLMPPSRIQFTCTMPSSQLQNLVGGLRFFLGHRLYLMTSFVVESLLSADDSTVLATLGIKCPQAAVHVGGRMRSVPLSSSCHFCYCSLLANDGCVVFCVDQDGPADLATPIQRLMGSMRALADGKIIQCLFSSADGLAVRLSAISIMAIGAAEEILGMLKSAAASSGYPRVNACGELFRCAGLSVRASWADTELMFFP
ncbi:hypothetical protein PR048_031002 [Dryococelus australis]|uniref:HAT C-terminal dimerisation domain-containing protein n=1 Tax=Dryococelus australis TaxID=614101 RepID=A0ABQ9G6Z7_9NEOP|nr:hypothetical protein PR048_031002 [Dryococelus australis]